MNRQDEIQQECPPNDVEFKAVGEFVHWQRIERVIWWLVMPVIFPLSVVVANCIGYVGIDGLIIPSTLFALVLLLSNFKPVRPVRIAREVIWMLVMLYATFALHCWVEYLYDVRTIPLGSKLMMMVGVFFFSMPMIALSLFFDEMLGKRKFARMGEAQRTKRMKRMQNWLGRKVDGFLARHPSLVIAKPRECLFLCVRHVAWGTIFSLLATEVYVFANAALEARSDAQELKRISAAKEKPIDLKVDNPFEIDIGEQFPGGTNSQFRIESFAGEKFGRVLSGDVERKKLAEPVGVIDELMLQADGHPDRRLRSIYGHKYLGNVTAEEANRIGEEAFAALQRQLQGTARPIVFSSEVPGFLATLKPSLSWGERTFFCKVAYSRDVYALVIGNDDFFQDEKVLKLHIGRMGELRYDPNLLVTEVLGRKIGEPMRGGRELRKPFWKFETVWRNYSNNRIVSAFMAAHDISALDIDEAKKEFEEAREAVGRLHGISMNKIIDYDDYVNLDSIFIGAWLLFVVLAYVKMFLSLRHREKGEILKSILKRLWKPLATFAFLLGLLTAYFYIGGIEWGDWTIPNEAELRLEKRDVPDKDNAYLALMALTNLYHVADNDQENEKSGDDSAKEISDNDFVKYYGDPFNSEDGAKRTEVRRNLASPKRAEKILADNAKFFDAFQAALSREKFCNNEWLTWHREVKKIKRQEAWSPFNPYLPDYRWAFRFTQLVALRGQVALEKGDMETAVSAMRNINSLGLKVLSSPCTMLDYQVGIWIKKNSYRKMCDAVAIGQIMCYTVRHGENKAHTVRRGGLRADHDRLPPRRPPRHGVLSKEV